jgi:broad specificity phosphatase PhoE
LSRAWVTRFPHESIPGAERFDTFKRRVARELNEIVTANPGSCVAIVTHAGVARLLVARALDVPDRQLFRIAVDPSALSVIDVFRGGATVQVVNG